MKALTGIIAALMRMNDTARRRTGSVVLYSCGTSGAMTAMTAPTAVHSTTAKAMSLRSSSTARSVWPEPSSCPTMIETVVPMERKAQKKRFEIVMEMFSAETTSSPRTEKHWFIVVMPLDHRSSLISSGRPSTAMRFMSAPGTYGER